MIGEILALLSSGPVGALIGGGLAIWQKRNDLEALRINHALERDKWVHERGLRQMDIDQVKAEAEGRREVAVIEGDAKTEAARMDAIARAQASDRITPDEMKAAGKVGRFFLVMVSVIQKIIRPVLTAALVGTALYLNIELMQLLRSKTWGALQPVEQKEIALQSLAWIIAQASACIQYWMVSRGTGK